MSLVNVLRRQSLAAMREHGEEITVHHVTGTVKDNTTGKITTTTQDLPGFGIRDYTAKTLGDRYGAQAVEGSYELSVVLEDMDGAAPVVGDKVEMTSGEVVKVVVPRPVPYQGKNIMFALLVAK